MNGARTTFMRRGYLLTALSALLLLAASAGTASAQTTPVDTSAGLEGLSVTLQAPRSVTEGNDATITVRGTADVGPLDVMASDRQVTVTLSVAEKTGAVTAESGTTGQVDDVVILNPTVTLNFPASSSARQRTTTATVTIRTNHDLDAEDEAASIAATATPTPSSGGDIGATFTIADDETQEYKLTLSSTHAAPGSEPREGSDGSTGNSDVMVDITADPEHVDDNETLTLHIMQAGKQATGYGFFSDSETMPTSMVTVGAGEDNANMRTVAIRTPLNDMNRDTDTITVEAYSGRVGADALEDSLDIEVHDVHLLPLPSAISVVAKDDQGNMVDKITEGGDPVYLTVTVDRTAAVSGRRRVTAENLVIDVKADDPGSYEVTPARAAVMGVGKANAEPDPIKVVARADENANDDELVLSVVVSGQVDGGRQTFGSGESVHTFTINVDDETKKKVWPRGEGEDSEAYAAVKKAKDAAEGEDGFNPGESFTVGTDELFQLADGYTATYGVSTEAGGVVDVSSSGDTITVAANKAGTAKVTVTATARMEVSSFNTDQTRSEVAHIMFPVDVVDVPLKVTVAAVPKEIDEGGTSEITATANRAVVSGDGEVVVDLEVLVGDAELEAESIMIAEGEMSGSVMLTAGEDDDYEDETVTVLASGSGIDGNMQVNIAVADTDMAPDALVVTLHAPEDVMEGNIVEGMSYDIMVTANRAVTDDEGEVEVMIMRDRSKSDADDDDFEVTSATIMAGEDSATATLMVTEDDMPDAGHAMGEVLVLYGESDHAEVEGELMFTIWDEMVPALPLIAQLLLALFLMAGGTRLYRRRQS